MATLPSRFTIFKVTHCIINYLNIILDVVLLVTDVALLFHFLFNCYVIYELVTSNTIFLFIYPLFNLYMITITENLCFNSS